MKKLLTIIVLIILGLIIFFPKKIRTDKNIIEGKVENISCYCTESIESLSLTETLEKITYNYEITISYNNETYVLEKNYLPSIVKEGNTYNFTLETNYYNNGKNVSKVTDFYF